MTNSEIEARYQDIPIPDSDDKRNVYACRNGHYTLTTHQDQGVTPMFIMCKVCGETAASMMYNVSQEGVLLNKRTSEVIVPNREEIWIRPTLEQLLEVNTRGHINTVDHVLRGGVIFLSDLQALLN